ncbi:hypothetical protein B0H14DRAFT_3143941 [Mycena olivaceomarginata]|nr:hypothetical protein B0H14DRAFT_3143941 [Mycena olivaceomarginata]
MTTSALNADPEPPVIAPLPYVALLTEMWVQSSSALVKSEYELNTEHQDKNVKGNRGDPLKTNKEMQVFERGQEGKEQPKSPTLKCQPQPKNPPDDEDSPRPMKQDGVASPAKRPPSQMLISECTSYRYMDFVPAKPTRQLRAMVSKRAELVSTRNQIVEALDFKKIVLILAEHKRLKFLKRGRRKERKEVIVTTLCCTFADEFPSSLINIISANPISFDKSTGWSSSEIMPIELLIEYVFTPHVACRLISISMEVSDSEAEDIRTESPDYKEELPKKSVFVSKDRSSMDYEDETPKKSVFWPRFPLAMLSLLWRTFLQDVVCARCGEEIRLRGCAMTEIILARDVVYKCTLHSDAPSVKMGRKRSRRAISKPQ